MSTMSNITINQTVQAIISILPIQALATPIWRQQRLWWRPLQLAQVTESRLRLTTIRMSCWVTLEAPMEVVKGGLGRTLEGRMRRKFIFLRYSVLMGLGKETNYGLLLKYEHWISLLASDIPKTVTFKSVKPKCQEILIIYRQKNSKRKFQYLAKKVM